MATNEGEMKMTDIATGTGEVAEVDIYARPYEVRHYVVQVPPPVLCPSAVASVLCGLMRVYGVTVFAGRPTPTTFDFYNWSGNVVQAKNEGEVR